MSDSGVLRHGFAPTTSIDHRSWVWVASILSLIYSLLSLAARAFGKWGLLWYDDGVLGVAYVAALAHWGLLFHATATGLAVSSLAISPEALHNAAQTYFAARITFFVAHCLAKLSILVFTRRIFAGGLYNETLIFRISYAFTIVYGILAVLLSSAGCKPSESLVPSPNAVCASNMSRWAALTAFDGITELLVLAMPVWFLSKNKLGSSRQRIVIFVYMFRLIVIAFTIATTVSYFNFLNNGTDSIDIATVVAWQEVLLSFSLISASFPCLRSFIWAFMSRGLMTMYGNTVAGSQPASRGGSIHLRSMSKSQASRTGSETGVHRSRLRPELGSYRVDVSHGRRRNSTGAQPRSGPKASDDSDQMIIRQETSYRVESIRIGQR